MVGFSLLSRRRSCHHLPSCFSEAYGHEKSRKASEFAMVRKNLFQSTWSAVRKVPRTLGHVVRLALRKVKLQILPQLTKWKAQSEEPKVVIYKNRGIAVFSILVHAVPFAGVMALLVLNINTFFIGNLSTSAVTAFQFAAKLPELLMQASLADILLYAIRWQIVRNQDLPPGGLVAPLRTADVSYLCKVASS
ncbi:hypothetical protein LTS15_002171 [Exophiala xenobiotica]|nr:hypothetical protein LTS15_002171 [Exophiala xenobiotica]